MRHADLATDYRGVPWDKLRRAASRGTLVHSLVAGALITGRWQYDLGLTFVEPGVAELVEAAEQFFTTPLFRIETSYVERALYSQAWGFAGTVDWKGRIDGVPSIIDFKTTAVLNVKAAGYQTAGYEILDNSNGGEQVEARFALHLRQDATWHLEPLDDPDDGPVYLAALQSAQGVSAGFWLDDAMREPEF
jgi:hypothetical protein